MNILKQAEELKQLTDQQLAGVRGRVPDYLAVAELQRRQQMRQAYQADMAHAQKGRGTVSDELWASVQQPQPQMNPMMQQPQQQPPGPPPQAMSIGGLVQHLARGGMVRYGGGSQDSGTVPLPSYTREQFEAAAGPRADPAAMLAQAQQMYGNDNLAGIMQEMAAQKAQAVVDKPSVWQFLIRNGAAMMASRNPTPLGGLGEGITAALNGYSEDRDKFRADKIRLQQAAMDNLKQRAGVAEQQNRRLQGIASLGGELMGQENSRWNTIGAGVQNAREAGARQGNELTIHQMQIDAQKERDKAQQPYHDALTRKASADALSQEDENALIKQMGRKNYEQWKSDLAHRAPQMDSFTAGLLAEQRTGVEGPYSKVLALKMGAGTKEERENAALRDDIRARYALYLKADPIAAMDPDKNQALLEKATRDEIAVRQQLKGTPTGVGPIKADFTYKIGSGLSGAKQGDKPALNWGSGGTGHAKPVPGQKLGISNFSTAPDIMSGAFAQGDYSNLPEGVRRAIGVR